MSDYNGTQKIDDDARERFAYVRGAPDSGVALMAVLFDGVPANVIAAVAVDGDYTLTPLYLELSDALFDRLTPPIEENAECP